VRILDSGEDRLLADLEGKATHLEVSASGDQVAVVLHSEIRHAFVTALVSGDGGIRELDAASWLPIGWLGEQKVVLTRGLAGDVSPLLGVADFSSGRIEVVFP
jgi:hypothetical protein